MTTARTTELVSAMRSAAGNDADAINLARFIEKSAVEVPLLPKTVPPVATREAFQADPALSVKMLGLDPDPSRTPRTYADYLELVGFMNRGRATVRRAALPKRWNRSKLALSALDDSTAETALPKPALAVYLEQFGANAKHGLKLECHALYYALAPASQFWLGVSALSAAFSAHRNIDRYRSEGIDRAQVDEGAAAAILEVPAEPESAVVEAMNEGFRMVCRLLNRYSGGIIYPAINTFNVRAAADPIAALKQCTEFVVSQFESQEAPRSERERAARWYLIEHAVMTYALPDALVRELMRAMGIVSKAAFK